MDITVEIMLPPRGSDWTVERHGSYAVFMPVAVYALKTIATIGMQRTGYLHVTGMPALDLVKVNEVLKTPLYAADGVTPVERSEWQGDVQTLTPAERNRLLADRQLTVPSNKANTLFKNLRDSDIQLSDVLA